MSTGTRHTGHHLSLVKWTTPISGKPSRLSCECGWSFEGLPDRRLEDPHQNFVRRYLAHRRDVGAPLLSKGAGPGWGRLEIEGAA